MSTLSSKHHFNCEFAATYGVAEAVVIHFFQKWIGLNMRKKNGKETRFREERWWACQTRDEMAAHFPYLSSSQISKLIDGLVEKGILLKGNYNKTAQDQTIWYAFADQERFIFCQEGNLA